MPRERSSLCLVVSVAAAIAHAMIAAGSAGHIETAWDEAVDRRIALGLRDHALVGEQPPLDPSQTRLPMYVTALAYRLTGRDDLALAREVSVAAGALTVLAAGLLGGSLIGGSAGALAAVLLALSPYFLSFSRIAMTEGDVLFACLMTFTLWAFIGYLKRPTMARCVGTAILLALAVGAKFYAAILILVFAVLIGSTRSPRPLGGAHATRRDIRHYHRVLLVGWIVAGCAWLLTIRWQFLGIAGWAMLLVIWGYAIAVALSRRTLDPRPWAALSGMYALAGLTFFAVMPVHLIENRIVRELLHRMITWDHRVPLALCIDHLRLYSGIVLIKLTVPLGVLTAAGIVSAAFRERDQPRWRPLVLTVIWYVIALCFLPLRQTFYLMGVYPLLMILTAGLIDQIGAWLRKFSRGSKTAWTILITAFLANLAWQDRAAYPHFHLFGYGLIGERWLGAPSLGYRNLIQTPSDGVESLAHWCRGHVAPGQRVVSYVWEDHILDPLLAGMEFDFVPRGRTLTGADAPPPAIAKADFVLLHINNRLGYGDRPPDWPDPVMLKQRFEPVETVRRDGLDVAWVYGRRAAPTQAAPGVRRKTLEN